MDIQTVDKKVEVLKKIHDKKKCEMPSEPTPSSGEILDVEKIKEMFEGWW